MVCPLMNSCLVNVQVAKSLKSKYKPLGVSIDFQSSIVQVTPAEVDISVPLRVCNL